MAETRQRIRVTHIASGDLWAGAEVQLFNLAVAQRDSGRIEPGIILLNEGLLAERLRHAGVRVVILNESRLSAPRILAGLIAELRRNSPDLIHTHRRKENILGALAGLLSGGIPSVRTVHGAGEHSNLSLPQRVFDALDRLSGRHFQRRIVSVSRELAAQLRRTYGASRVAVIENGIDVEAVREAATPPARLPGGAESMRVGIAGRLVPVKRLDLFLDIAQRLAAHDERHFEFYIIGEGPLQPEIETSIDERQIRGPVHLLGFVDNPPAYLAALDALLITSDHEGLPMVLLEALSVELPVIAHDVGGISDVLDRGRFGTLIQTQEAAKYTTELRRLAENRKAYAEKAKQGLEHVRKRYSSRVTADAYTDLYDSVLGRGIQ